MKTDPPIRPEDDPRDALGGRYREAVRLDGERRPGDAVRAAILAQAAAQAQAAQEPVQPVAAVHPPAANDGRWRLSAVASVMVMGLAALLAWQVERAPEHDAAPMAAAPAPAESPVTEPLAAQEERAPQPGRSSLAEERERIAAPAPATPVARSARPAEPALPAEAAKAAEAAPDPQGGTARGMGASPAAPAAPAPRAKRLADSPAAVRESQAAAPPAAVADEMGRATDASAGSSANTAADRAAAGAPATAAAPRAPGPREQAYGGSMRQAAPATPPAPVTEELRRETLREDRAAVSPRPQATAAPAPPTLAQAAARGQPEQVRALLAGGAAVDARDAQGRTALLEAVLLGDGSRRFVDVARALLDARADPNAADRDGITPLAHARRLGQDDMARLIESYGGR